MRRRDKGKDPSQIYSARMPAERLEELRALAERHRVAPPALTRRVAVDGLDREVEIASRVAVVRDDLGEGSEQLVVMTPEQFKKVVHEAIEMTASEVLKSVLDVVKKIQANQEPVA